jgi:hypothetical protein
VTLVLELPTELETELAAEAARLGLPLEEYALRLLATGSVACPKLGNGADLLAYWKNAGVVGTRPETVDPSAHARVLRQQAEKRERP